MFSHLVRVLAWAVAGCVIASGFHWAVTLHPALVTFGDVFRVLFVIAVGAALLLDDAVLGAINKADNALVKLQYYATIGAIFLLFLLGWFLMRVTYVPGAS